MKLHLPQTTPEVERPSDIVLAREKLPVTLEDPRASLIDPTNCAAALAWLNSFGNLDGFRYN